MLDPGKFQAKPVLALQCVTRLESWQFVAAWSVTRWNGGPQQTEINGELPSMAIPAVEHNAPQKKPRRGCHWHPASAEVGTRLAILTHAASGAQNRTRRQQKNPKDLNPRGRQRQQPLAVKTSCSQPSNH
jgi:hypothetical protein